MAFFRVFIIYQQRQLCKGNEERATGTSEWNETPVMSHSFYESVFFFFLEAITAYLFEGVCKCQWKLRAEKKQRKNDRFQQKRMMP